MTKLKLNVLIIPLNYANEPTSEIDPLVCKRFLHLEDPAIDLNELKERIETRFQRLYPDEDRLQIEGFQESDLCDLDPDYCISGVFSSGDILRTIVKKQFKSQILSGSNTRSQGTPSPPLPTGATEFAGSHKRTKQHGSSAGPSFKPQTIEDQIVATTQQRVISSTSRDNGKGHIIASDVLAIPRQAKQFSDIVVKLPNFEARSHPYTYIYEGDNIKRILYFIQQISLWYSYGNKTGRFLCKGHSKPLCTSYITLSIHRKLN
ncbi:uncharacterized protein J8A68_003093 [[Candida] subhashii]|uniref:Nucleolar protein Dnt1-like N-terminal domain-containing protein n=1 Tax=[Candida] subhashii TaxID=561895 RepID=A0A8J5QN13_9ASCO|nr:uncharacterized protein J8A68_003093 [[Candida] subhashii]KAG7663345.1 hypothetical protein J8A68_003093 [[Candida] subhashii]